VGLAYSLDGSSLAGNCLDTVVVWDAVTARIRLVAPVEDSRPGIVAVSGNVLVVNSTLWDIASRERLPRQPDRTQFRAAAMAADGRYVAWHTGGTLTLWDVATGVSRSATDWAYISAITFSSDSVTVAAKDETGRLRLWDVASLQPLGEPFAGRDFSGTTLTFSPDEKVVWSGGPAEALTDSRSPKALALFRWDLDLESWKQRACSIANRNLTRDEWVRFIGEREAYRKTCATLP
jgi:WD40 repeat protein